MVVPVRAYTGFIGAWVHPAGDVHGGVQQHSALASIPRPSMMDLGLIISRPPVAGQLAARALSVFLAQPAAANLTTLLKVEGSDLLFTSLARLWCRNR